MGESKQMRLHLRTLYYGLAEGNYLIGDLRGAENGINQILRIDPHYLPALKLKSRIQLDRGDGAAALELANTALSLAPDDAQAQLLKALILVQLEQPNEAMSLIEQVRSQAPATARIPAPPTSCWVCCAWRMATGMPRREAFNSNYLANPDDPGQPAPEQ